MPASPGSFDTPKIEESARNTLLTLHRLAEDFLADLCADWTKNGAGLIANVRKKHPAVYFKILASLIPREVPLPVQNEFEHLSNDELANELIEVAAALKRGPKQST